MWDVGVVGEFYVFWVDQYYVYVGWVCLYQQVGDYGVYEVGFIGICGFCDQKVGYFGEVCDYDVVFDVFVYFDGYGVGVFLCGWRLEYIVECDYFFVGVWDFDVDCVFVGDW